MKTKPTGFNLVPPSGPATPVVDNVSWLFVILCN